MTPADVPAKHSIVTETKREFSSLHVNPTNRLSRSADIVSPLRGLCYHFSGWSDECFRFLFS